MCNELQIVHAFSRSSDSKKLIIVEGMKIVLQAGLSKVAK